MEARVEHYLSELSAIAPRLPGNDLPWLRAAREEALETFARVGFPSPREEDWKYTRIAPIEKRAFKPVVRSAAELAPDALERHALGLDCHRLVFVNGTCAPRLSAPARCAGLTVTSLEGALEAAPGALEKHLTRYANAGASGFSALNTAFMGDGAYVHIGAGAVLEKPILLVFVSAPEAQEVCVQPRVLLVADAGAEAEIIEHYVGIEQAVYFNNAITEIALGPNARVAHYKLQDESLKAFHVATLQVRQERDSRFASHSVSLGGRLVRNDINCALAAEGAECELNGLYMGTGRQHVDYHTRIDHCRPHGTSREYYKGVLDGHARGVFNGRVYVHPNAQKTDAEQANDNLLLSRDAEVDTKPQLEIFADDVKCAHGATVGELDESMIFYLRSRGIDESAARGLLTYGFASDVLARMRLEPVRARLEERLVAWLPNAEQVREMVT